MSSTDKGLATQEMEALLGDSYPRQLGTLFRNTVEDAPVGIAFADRAGRYRHCNRAFCVMLGFDADELKGEQISSRRRPASSGSGAARLHISMSKSAICARAVVRCGSMQPPPW
jgi:PAS domain-containing protein